MTSYSALCPIILGFFLPSLFNEALRAFYCILRACWPTRVHPGGNQSHLSCPSSLLYQWSCSRDTHVVLPRPAAGPFSRNQVWSLFPQLALRTGRRQDAGGKSSRVGELRLAWADSSCFSTHMDAAENILWGEGVLSQSVALQACSMASKHWHDKVSM